MKLIVLIPCYNEEQQIQKTIKSIPEQIKGITDLEILIVNDASTDNTLSKLQGYKDLHILNLKQHIGLAQVFYKGIQEALNLGADIVVNVDADLQYDPKEIETLIQPIMNGRSKVVIGERPYLRVSYFPWSKKVCLFIGSILISLCTAYRLLDVASGFRAFHKDSLYKLKVYSSFTYTIETILFFSFMRVPLTTIKLKNISKTRKSRLFRTNIEYICKSFYTFLKTICIYRCRWLRLKNKSC